MGVIYSIQGLWLESQNDMIFLEISFSIHMSFCFYFYYDNYTRIPKLVHRYNAYLDQYTIKFLNIQTQNNKTTKKM